MWEISVFFFRGWPRPAAAGCGSNHNNGLPPLSHGAGEENKNAFFVFSFILVNCLFFCSCFAGGSYQIFSAIIYIFFGDQHFPKLQNQFYLLLSSEIFKMHELELPFSVYICFSVGSFLCCFVSRFPPSMLFSHFCPSGGGFENG